MIYFPPGAATAVLDRVGYGIEISPAYCDVAVHRIANLAGEEPVLAETGQARAELAAARGVLPGFCAPGRTGGGCFLGRRSRSGWKK